MTGSIFTSISGSISISISMRRGSSLLGHLHIVIRDVPAGALVGIDKVRVM
jgi:hypothetical protein